MIDQNPIEKIKQSTNIAQKAVELAHAFGSTDLVKAIQELQADNLALIAENMSLKEQLKEKQKYNMQFASEDNCYWNIREDGTKEGPYCSNCYDTKGLLVRALGGKNGTYHCPNCKTFIYTSNYTPRKVNVINNKNNYANSYIQW